MSAVATEPAARPRLQDSEHRLFEPSEVTLEDSILGVWEALEARGRARCPICRGEMLAGAGCSSCGSELS